LAFLSKKAVLAFRIGGQINGDADMTAFVLAFGLADCHVWED